MKDMIIFKGKEFKKYPRNANYYVSRDGEVYSIYSQKIIKQNLRGKENKQYPYVDIAINGKQKHIYIHRMVYETWTKPLKEGEQVNHRDDKELHNNIDNLYVGSQMENINDCFSNFHRVGHVYYLTLFDKQENKTITFCPAKKFIEYSGHPNKSGSLNKFFSKNWFKKRYEIIEFKRINNLDELKGVTTKDDECNPVE